MPSRISHRLKAVKGMVVVGAPGSAIVHQHCGRQSITAEGAGQHAAHGLAALVGAGLKHLGAGEKRELVVEHVVSGWQRLRLSKGKWPLKSICQSSFGAARSKRLQGRCPGAAAPSSNPRAAQDAGHGARRQRWAGPWPASNRASLRPPHELRDSWRSRITACSTSAAVRAGLRRGRFERSSRPLAPARARNASATL